MNQKISVLIVDDNVEITQELSSYINAQSDMTVAAAAYNGEEALNLIQTAEPDIVILDLIMPKLDGFDVLERLETMSLVKNPKIVLYSVMERGMEFVSSLIHTNIDSYILKPQSCEYICNVIRSVMTKSKILWSDDSDLEVVVTQYLKALGVPAKYRGYQYCRSAIIMLIRDTKLAHKITTKLYPQIADIYFTKPSCVERDIRCVIKKSLNRGNPQLIKRIFGFEHYEPSNSELLVGVADQIRLQMQET